jgi:DNA (cytosine-5)-methyltransferase 1
MGMKVLSLFSGIGGLDLGFEWAGFETVAFCEIEEFPRKVLNKHWPNVPIIEDVRNVTKESVPRVDVIIGGFPCQDISYAGKGAGIDYDLSEQEGTRSGLWWEYWRTIRELRPRYVVAENVSALTNRGLDIVLGSLAQIGYDAEWQIVSAAGVGAAHIRERIFIVAYPSGEYKESIRRGEQSGGAEPCKNGSASEVLAHSQHRGVQVGRGADGPSEYVRNEGGIRQDDFGQGIKEETGKALADPLLQRCEAINGQEPGGKVVIDRRSPSLKDQPDWFGGLQSQPHPVSFKVDNAPVEGLEGGSGREPQQEEKGERNVRRVEYSNGRKESRSEWLEIEYDFRGVAYGVSDRVGALKGYGNAVVPQVAYLVAMAVRQHAEENGVWE